MRDMTWDVSKMNMKSRKERLYNSDHKTYTYQDCNFEFEEHQICVLNGNRCIHLYEWAVSYCVVLVVHYDDDDDCDCRMFDAVSSMMMRRKNCRRHHFYFRRRNDRRCLILYVVYYHQLLILHELQRQDDSQRQHRHHCQQKKHLSSLRLLTHSMRWIWGDKSSVIASSSVSLPRA